MRAFANAKHGSKSPSYTAFIENDSEVKKGGVRNIRTPPLQMRSLILEREINAAAHHAEVIVRTVDKVPAEIVDPADVWREANFQATADLTDCLCLRTCMTLCLDDVEAFPRFSNKHIVRSLASAKDRAASAKNVR